MAQDYVRLDKDNAAVLLVDHQAGLLSLVRDIDRINLKQRTCCCKCSKILQSSNNFNNQF